MNDSTTRLDPSQLRARCDLSRMGFETTEELEDLHRIVGQSRASEALNFGLGIRRKGFHLFALGPDETEKRWIVRHFVEKRARSEEVPPDLCYVNDFDRTHRPRALSLPPGRGRRLASGMDRFLSGLPPALRSAFESEEYQARRQGVAQETGERHEASLEALQERARERSIALLRTPGGFVFAPIRNGDVVPPKEFEELPKEEQDQVQEEIRELQGELQEILRKVPRQQRQLQEQIREVDREVAELTVRELLAPLREDHHDLSEVRRFLDRVQEHVVENVQAVLKVESSSSGPQEAPEQRPESGPLTHPGLRQYRVNVLVDHSDSEHAPLVYEEHPTYQNLVGRVEYASVMGTLVTDFNLIKPGALHRANGGYLLLDAHRVLGEPLAWDGLKRTLQEGELRIESPQEALGMVRTVSLDPEPTPLQVKVLLLGSAPVYFLLSELDPDFRDLFKVAADFDDRMPRDSESEATYAHLVAALARREELLPLHRSAVEKVIEWTARLAGDSERLSTRTGGVLDLLQEADHWCREAGGTVVDGEHVWQTLEARRDRAGRIRDRMQEEILRDTVVVETDGERVGEVNGLSVLQHPGLSFGRPSRISARVRMGRGEVVDIEREVALSGPIHSKGVLILSAFLGARYAFDRPLSLSASLVFEQSYSGVDGDSASLAELLALLSAIGEIPLDQSWAITGSVDQHGRVQAVGGVNEKIEGYFHICRERGLTGRQGVLIPESNAKHLMLRPEVVEAVEEGRFQIHTVASMDAAMERLSGLKVGAPDEEGRYPEGTANARVAGRLQELAERRREYLGSGAEGSP